jgi:hypothetical protein
VLNCLRGGWQFHIDAQRQRWLERIDVFLETMAMTLGGLDVAEAFLCNEGAAKEECSSASPTDAQSETAGRRHHPADTSVLQRGGYSVHCNNQLPDSERSGELASEE